MASRSGVAFVTLGCKVNQTESEAIAEALGGTRGGVAPESADVVVINTCTVTGEADRKARKAVRHALGLPRAPVVVVTGCLATLDAEGLRSLGDRVVVEADKDAVFRRVNEILGVAAEAKSAAERAVAPVLDRARAQLKVEDGCDAFCAYCIVPYARGLPKAVPASVVVERAERLVAAGATEIVLTGINIGRYDDDGARLPALLGRVAATGVSRIRLSSIEPGDVSEGLLEAASGLPAFCTHLHIPLQSGSDGVLARMGRPYDTAAYAATIARTRAAFPGIAVSTDLIAGLPGETEVEAAETAAFVEAMGFSRLHVFRYSARAGTPAAAMPGQVPPDVKAARAAALRTLGERLATSYAASRVGTRAELLVERMDVDGGPGDPAVAEGVTREYLRARVAHPPVEPGALLSFAAERADGAVLLGAATPERA